MRFQLKGSWTDEEDGLREDFEYDFIVNKDYTFTLREATNTQERENAGNWSLLEFEGEGTKIRLMNQNWGPRSFHDVVIKPSMQMPETVSGALFMHNNVPYIGE